MNKQAGGPDKQNDSRMIQAAVWAADTMGLDQVRLEPVSGDASFRRYFRFSTGNRSVVLMDAPPDKETGWLASCVREGEVLTDPTDAICGGNCGFINGYTLAVSWNCSGTSSASYSSTLLGVTTSTLCHR